MSDQLMVGQVLYGYCKGYFGRDHYGRGRVEAVGIDWVVVRDEDGHPLFGSGQTVHLDLLDCIRPEPGVKYD